MEESLELFQSVGGTLEEAKQLTTYVFNRPVGEPVQEVGGTLITLMTFISALQIDAEEAGEMELGRVWQKIDEIRIKHNNKPRNSPLPGSV